jgi:hypothetical protein
MARPGLPNTRVRSYPFEIEPWAQRLALGAALVVLSFVVPALASESPAGCTSNGVTLGIQANPTTIPNHQSVTFTVTLGNGSFPPNCDAGGISIQSFCPDTTGNPNIPDTLFSVTSLAADTPAFQVGTFQCTVSVNPGVTSATGGVMAAGVIHDDPATDNPFTLDQTTAVTVTTSTAAVPTLSGVAMVVLVVFLVLAAAFTLRRKRTA